ncbi:MAG: hypothetical protein AAF587_36320 [Bacteroidota bacterium]
MNKKEPCLRKKYTLNILSTDSKTVSYGIGWASHSYLQTVYIHLPIDFDLMRDTAFFFALLLFGILIGCSPTNEGNSRQSYVQHPSELLLGTWTLGQWALYHSLTFDTIELIVDNHLDTIYRYHYQIDKDQLVLQDILGNTTKAQIMHLDSNELHLANFLEAENQLVYTKKAFPQASIDRTSQLDSKLKALESLPQAYTVVDRQQEALDKTIFYAGIKALTADLPKQHIITENPHLLFHAIQTSEIALIKGRTPIRDKIYPRARIEEFVFPSPIQPAYLQDIFHLLKTDLRTWIEADKAQNALVIDQHRLYYISSGGHYMPNELKEIARMVAQSHF